MKCKYLFLSTWVEVYIGSKVQCLFCTETSTSEGRGEEMGGSGNFKNKAHRNFDPRNNSTPVYWCKMPSYFQGVKFIVDKMMESFVHFMAARRHPQVGDGDGIARCLLLLLFIHLWQSGPARAMAAVAAPVVVLLARCLCRKIRIWPHPLLLSALRSPNVNLAKVEYARSPSPPPPPLPPPPIAT